MVGAGSAAFGIGAGAQALFLPVLELIVIRCNPVQCRIYRNARKQLCHMDACFDGQGDEACWEAQEHSACCGVKWLVPQLQL